MDLSSYATKADLKGTTGVDTSNLAAKSDLASLKAQVHKIDVDKLNTAPADLKAVSATFFLVYFVCLKKSTLEKRKNIFCFTSKALFVLEIIKF